MIRADRKLGLCETGSKRHILQALQIDPVDSMVHIEIEDSVRSAVCEDGEIVLQLLKRFRGWNKKFLLQGILVHRIVIVGDSRAALMGSAVHSSVDDKIDSAVLIHRKDLDAMFRHVVTDIVGCRAAEGEHSGSNILATVVCPQLPACHKRCVLAPSTLYGMDSVTVSDSQNDPFSREQIGISCEELRHGPLVIHHVDPPGCPLHCKVFCHLVGFRLLAILRRHMSRDLHIGEISGQFL